LKKINIFLFLVLNLCVIDLSALSKKAWLFYVHMAAVNNLYQFSISDINELKKGTNENVNTLV